MLQSLEEIKVTLVRTTTGGSGQHPTVMLAPELSAEQRRAVKLFELNNWFPAIAAQWSLCGGASKQVGRLHWPLSTPADPRSMSMNHSGYRVTWKLLSPRPTWVLVLAVQLGQALASESPKHQTSMPAWATVDSASVHANSLDPVHALMTSVIRQRQLSPLRAARLFATVRVAQSEAIRHVADVNTEAISSLAASQALSWMLPLEDSATWAVPALFSASRLIESNAEVEARVHAAVWPVLAHVIDDGADARRRPLIKPDPKPGFWLRTPPLFAEQPAEPQGSNWKPWCPGTERLDVAPTVEHGSSQWHEELQHVAAVTMKLTADQKSIAQRWHLDAGSVTPPGVWNAIATSYVSHQPLAVARRIRVLAVLNMAMQDALVAAWRIKLQYWTERPITAIRREIDPKFEPLLVAPPFPGYVSGHSTVSAAAAGVLSHYFPEQKSRWHALAREAAVSRLYGGIHFVSDNEQGLALGLQVASVCLAAFEGTGADGVSAPITAPAGMSPDFFALPRMRALPE